MLRTLSDLWNVTSSVSKSVGLTWRASQALRSAQHHQPELIPTHYSHWGRSMLQNLKVGVEISGAPLQIQPALLVGNHVSYVDIMALASLHQINFVSKAEIAKWPLVGKGALAGGTIYVQRDSSSSKKKVAEAIRKAIVEDSKMIAVFPEGTTSIEGLPWRRGVFRIAHENRIPVQCFSVTYRPMRRAAYVDDDHILVHMAQLLREGGAQCHIEFHEPVFIENLSEDPLRLETWCKERVRARLQDQGWFLKA